MNDLLMALLGYGGGGAGNYGISGAPSNAFYNPIMGYDYGNQPLIGPMGTPSVGSTPIGGQPAQLGGMPAGDNKGGPQAGQGNSPAGAPTGVGSPGWIATHPDYKAPPNPGAGPLTFNPAGGPFAGRDQFGRYPVKPAGSVVSNDPMGGGGVGSPGWIATHPNYLAPMGNPSVGSTPILGGGVGSPSWIATHPNYKTPL